MFNAIQPKNIFSHKLKLFCGEIFSAKLFWLGLFLKLVLSAFFASKFLTDLFLPFVNFYTGSGFANPYQHFFLDNKTNIFPYPTLMLWSLSASYYILHPLSDFFAVFVLRIPILLADFVILLILSRWLKSKTEKLLILYWLSPVLIYINYLHGQLDVIPIAVLLLSLYFLFKEKFYLAAFFLGAAISCKTNVLLAAPFFFIYLFSKELKKREIFLSVVILLTTFLVINLPYLFSPGFVALVFLNSEQGKIFNLFYYFHEDVIFYFVPAVYFLLLVKAITIKGYNRDIFVMFLGFGFGVINLFIPPMQGWYYWIIPFFSYFYVKQKDAPIFLFALLQLCYFAYFFVIKNSDFLQILQLVAPQISILPNFYEIISGNFAADKIVSLTFTILQMSLLVNCFWIYRSGIGGYLKHKLVSKPYLIGISGDSGVGKTTLVSSLLDVFGQKNVTTICGDDMHRWERGHEKWREFTHLNPSANKLHNEISFLRALKNGKKIARKIYDHDDGKFTQPKIFEAKKIVILEGLHSFYVAVVREIFDVKIFIKPEKQLQTHWKIIRDQERGHNKDKVLEQIKKRQDDSEKFILSQEKYADVKIELFASDAIKNLGNKDEIITLNLRISFSNNIDVEPLVESLSTIESLKIEHGFNNGDEQFIKFSGEVGANKIKLCSDILMGHNFEEINLQEPKWSQNLIGLIQLFLAFYIIQTELNDEAKNN